MDDCGAGIPELLLEDLAVLPVVLAGLGADGVGDVDAGSGVRGHSAVERCTGGGMLLSLGRSIYFLFVLFRLFP